MIYYAIRHKATGELMPEVKKRGYSHWNPSNPNKEKVYAFLSTPRLLDTRRKAHRCVAMWNSNPNATYGKIPTWNGYEYGIKIVPDGRSKNDLEVVEVELTIK